MIYDYRRLASTDVVAYRYTHDGSTKFQNKYKKFSPTSQVTTSINPEKNILYSIFL